MFVLMLSIIIALFIVVFAVQNAAVVPIQFFIWSTELPLVLVIFCSVFAGALLMFCLALWRDLKGKISKKPKVMSIKTKGMEKDPIDTSDMKTSSTPEKIKVNQTTDQTEKSTVEVNNKP